MTTLCAIDFEFNSPTEHHMGLISCALQVEGTEAEGYWLRDPDERAACVARLRDLLAQGVILVSYCCHLAESPCLCALGFDPNAFSHRDLASEWRWLRNRDAAYNFGRCVLDGLPCISHPPVMPLSKDASDADREAAGHLNRQASEALQARNPDRRVVNREIPWGLLDCLYAGKLITTENYRSMAAEKADVRDRIILGGGDPEPHRERILAYNQADIYLLIKLAHRITGTMVKIAARPHLLVVGTSTSLVTLALEDVHDIQLRLGDWSARMGKYSWRGIPLNLVRLHRLMEMAPTLTVETRDHWVRNNPDDPIYRIGPSGRERQSLSRALSQSPYSQREVFKDMDLTEATFKRFYKTTGLDASKWPRTETGRLDLDKKAIARFASGDNLPKLYERHQKALTTLTTFLPRNERVEALQFIGSDGHQHPDFGPYGTQTGRNAAKAKSFLFAGPKWLRAMVDPPEGHAVIDLDFASQEFWISAVLSDDDAMREAYRSPDVYMSLAQKMGMYPPDLPIPTEAQRGEDWFHPHKKIRAVAKCLVLGMSYGAGAQSIAASIRDVLRDPTITDEQGHEWVAEYRTTFARYSAWVQSLRRHYRRGDGVMVMNGWRLGPDCTSALSYGNMPVQGTGVCILQRACELLDEAGIIVLAPLHDAVTLLAPAEDAGTLAAKAADLMIQAATDVLGEPGMRVGAPEVIHHGEIWLHGDQGREAWQTFKHHFNGLSQ